MAGRMWWLLFKAGLVKAQTARQKIYQHVVTDLQRLEQLQNNNKM